MKPSIRPLLVVCLLWQAGSAFAATDTPAGRWKQVDDVSGQQKSIIEITESGGKLQGKVVQLMNLSAEETARGGPHPVCKPCDGSRKDQPIEGMTILWDVTHDGDVWDGGKILDPKTGKVYKVKLTLTDGGRKLDVHGYVGFSLLGRSQVWERED